MPKQKTFRLKRTAKKYQSVHGGRITGTTGSYRVTKTKKRANPRGVAGSRRYNHTIWVASDGSWFKTKTSALRHARTFGGTVRKKREQFFDKSDYRSVPNLSVDSVGKWITAKAVKIVKSGTKKVLLIKR